MRKKVDPPPPFLPGENLDIGDGYTIQVLEVNKQRTKVQYRHYFKGQFSGVEWASVESIQRRVAEALKSDQTRSVQ